MLQTKSLFFCILKNPQKYGVLFLWSVKLPPLLSGERWWSFVLWPCPFYFSFGDQQMSLLLWNDRDDGFKVLKVSFEQVSHIHSAKASSSLPASPSSVPLLVNHSWPGLACVCSWREGDTIPPPWSFGGRLEEEGKKIWDAIEILSSYAWCHLVLSLIWLGPGDGPGALIVTLLLWGSGSTLWWHGCFCLWHRLWGP